MDPLELLKEDLKDDDYETQIMAIKKLHIIAVSLGPSRTRSELIPFLMEFTNVDNDEAHTAIAKQLGHFTQLLGGDAHITCILPILEKLCAAEELVVRDTAVKGLVNLVSFMSKADIRSNLMAVIQRLSNGDWFTCRVSATGLFVPVYPLVDAPTQADLRSLFNNLCNDDTPMVRKAAYQQLGLFGALVEKAHFTSEFLPVLKQLASADMDSMRVYTIGCCVDLAPKLDTADFAGFILPIVEALQDDHSWRVRQMLAKRMQDLCTHTNDTMIVSKRLLPLFAKLLNDKEAEVRVMACKRLGDVCAAVPGGMGIVDNIGAVLEHRASDPVQSVRIAFSKTLVQCCPYFGKETAAKLLVPLIQQMTKDESHEVRNHIVDSMDILFTTDCLGPAVISSQILLYLLDMSKDPKWRVRMAVVNKTCHLAKNLGPKTFEKKLQNILILSLSDHVYAIRESTCKQIGLIVNHFGGKWAAEKLFPGAFKIYDKTTNYLHRMTCLQVIEDCLKSSNCGGQEVVERHLVPIVLWGCEDDVPNVRILAAKVAGTLCGIVDANLVNAKLKPLLQTMSSDADGDVSYFAEQALKKIK